MPSPRPLGFWLNVLAGVIAGLVVALIANAFIVPWVSSVLHPPLSRPPGPENTKPVTERPPQAAAPVVPASKGTPVPVVVHYSRADWGGAEPVGLKDLLDEDGFKPFFQSTETEYSHTAFNVRLSDWVKDTTVLHRYGEEESASRLLRTVKKWSGIGHVNLDVELCFQQYALGSDTPDSFFREVAGGLGLDLYVVPTPSRYPRSWVPCDELDSRFCRDEKPSVYCDCLDMARVAHAPGSPDRMSAMKKCERLGPANKAP